jgi:hypothetical protein
MSYILRTFLLIGYPPIAKKVLKLILISLQFSEVTIASRKGGMEMPTADLAEERQRDEAQEVIGAESPVVVASLSENLNDEEICRIVGTKNVMGTCSG